MRILIVEDDELNAKALELLFTQQNYAVEKVADGQAVADLVEAFEYDLILSDVMLPGLDGVSLCRQLRSQGCPTPILLLTGKDSGHDKAMGLDAGADDYVVKPFDPEELTARVRALLRRSQGTEAPILEWENIRLDPKACEVTYADVLLSLTPKEYALLELLMRNNRRVFSCGMVLEHLWTYEDTPGEEAVRTHIKGLRQKLKAAGAPPDLIETVYGIGYRLKPLPEPAKPQVMPEAEPQPQAALTDVWVKFQPRINQQVGILEQAATALTQGSLATELHQQARQEAHTLAGGLGTFGYAQGSQFARSIEHLLQETILTEDQALALQQNVIALRSEISRADLPSLRSFPPQPPYPILEPSTAGPREGLTVPPSSLGSIEAQIMVVDDDPLVSETVTTLLQPWGFQVTTLTEPSQVWQRLAEHTPDLLVLDVEMPKMNGIDLCQKIRDDARWEQLPIIFLTAHTEAEIVNRVYSVGADDFVSKPIMGPELIVRILNRLERTRLQRQLSKIEPLAEVLKHDERTHLLERLLDNAEQQHNEAALQQQVAQEQLVGEIAAHIRQSLDLKDILSTAVTEVQRVLATDRVLIFKFNPDWSGKALVESLGATTWTSVLEMKIYDPCFAEAYIEPFRQGHVTAFEDVHCAGLTPCYIEFLEQFQVQASLIVPILQGDRLWGLLIAHHCSAPRQWQQSEINLLTRLATQLAIALQQSELYQKLQIELAEREQVEIVLQEARKNLESKVTERTAELISVNQQLNQELFERKATESALKVSQERFSGILEIANDAIISVNASEAITLFNQGAEQIFGYESSEVIGQSLDLLLPNQAEMIHRQRVASGGPSTRIAERQELFGRRKDGTEFPAEASISKLELETETLYTVILRDISQRKQAQETLERMSHQNELILNAIGEGLCGLNLQGQFTFVNAAAEQYLGYTADDLMNQTLEILFPSVLEPDHRELVPEALASIYASLQAGTPQPLSEAIFCRRDRFCFPVEYLSTPILEQGKIIGAVITFKDISDRKVMERMKDEFISIVSHELRTPLTSIHGSLRMLASGMLSTQADKNQRLLKIAADSTDRLVRLINDVLDVERIESGNVEMKLRPCWAEALMTQAANTMQGMAEQEGVTLIVQPISAQIRADPDRILQTFTNLLSNAIKFSTRGSTVWLSAETTQPQVLCFSVQDRGRGIAADKIDLIFERFQQADSSDTRNHEGTGLGLSICRSIVQQHGGQIWVDSQLGQGSTFYFTIPQPTT
ncbi:Alkaline phosphatase synthesis transcriptional regulatory protein SphR [Acaryochloris thomasi RCC1774]|uniref:histidine kinase n=1 Tax=Acaryochloris thomasi RCC1774 TaxID=1764569 RepID=A0A2W1K065_9CYAN|nr:response regulator [Acaryochloris thomasi]PZD73687.1 Alkaline phosphatase synthesis transcriptional regulatory protein SphR [Acaryochloris thomasi RCC1774]